LKRHGIEGKASALPPIAWGSGIYTGMTGCADSLSDPSLTMADHYFHISYAWKLRDRTSDMESESIHPASIVREFWRNSFEFRSEWSVDQ
jgi:hypothetical protein